jgi:hypothetical protein
MSTTNLRKSITAIACLLLWGATGCQNNADKITPTTEATVQKIDQQIGTAPEKFIGKLNELFTLDMAAAATGYPASEANSSYDKTLQNPTTHSMQYSWEKGRTRSTKVSTMTINTPIDDVIELRWLKVTDRKFFEQQYQNPTAEQLKEADKAVKDALDQKQAAGEINQETKDGAKGLAAELGKNVRWDNVEGIGEAAKWNSKTQELKVFNGQIEFEIRIDLGLSNEAHLTKAKTAAAAILQKL